MGNKVDGDGNGVMGGDNDKDEDGNDEDNDNGNYKNYCDNHHHVGTKANGTRQRPPLS